MALISLRQLLDHAFLVGVRVADARLELVVEEVIALFQRLRLGLPLDAAAPVDVEVREDPEEPRPEAAPIKGDLAALERVTAFVRGI